MRTVTHSAAPPDPAPYAAAEAVFAEAKGLSRSLLNFASDGLPVSAP